MTRTAHSILAVDLHGRPDFHSRCPIHGRETGGGIWIGKKSVRHLGQQMDIECKRFDVWLCKDYHNFTSTPMPGMPTPEELPAWLKAHQLEAAGVDVRKKGA